MAPPPPLQDVLSAIRDVMLPAASVSALTYVLLLSLGRWANGLASTVAILASLAFVNWNKSFFPWIPDTPSWHQLPRATLYLAILALVLNGIVSVVRRFSSSSWQFRFECLGWLIRLAGLAFTNWLIIPTELQVQKPWIWPAITLLALLNWRVLEQLASKEANVELALLIAVNLLLGSGVLLYAHSARFMEWATALGCAAMGLAIVSQLTNSRTAGALPVFIGMWPGLLLAGYWGNSSEDIPLSVFALVAAAPLTLLPWLIPFTWRGPRWLHCSLWLVLTILPLVAALIIAGQYGKLPWEEE
jgi:hypothetical protein